MPRVNDESIDPMGWLDPTVENVAESVDRRNFMKATGAAALLGALGTSQAGAQEDSDRYYRKRRPTAFTDEERENALNNIEEYEWARAHRDSYVDIAETILDYWDDEDLWNLIPSQLVPRGNNLRPGITYSSTALANGWKWEKMDPEWDHLYATAPSFDWEVTNQDSGITIPTNDYAAYRESGRDDEGKFDPELADDSLLVNTKHPELGEDWGVDDGTGFVDDEGHIGEEGWEWNPVSWLNHWAVIYAARQFVWRLSVAYILTGDRKYAHPVGVILDRVGDVYGELNLEGLEEYYGTSFSNSTGGTGQGKFVGAIWESSQIREWLWSYDRIFPGMDGDDELVSFLDGKQSEYPGLDPKDTLGGIRENIETGFVHEMLPAFQHAQIRGNFGFHQATLAVAAVVADDPDGMTGDAVDYVFQPGTLLGPGDEGNPTPGRWYTTGGDINGFLVGSPQSGYMVDEDGYPTESAPHYNTSQQNSMETFANAIGGYDGYEGADLFQHPKFKNAVDSHWQLTFGEYIPQIANTHGAGNPKAVAGATPLNDRVIQSADFALMGYDQYRTVELAQWTYMLNGLSTDGLELGIFHPQPEGIGDEIQAIVDEHGAFPNATSNQQPAYGFSALRDGDAETPVGVYQYYGRNSFGTGSAHTHRDTLNLGVYGYGLDLAPELGRQGSDWEGNNLSSWVESTPAHNTVTVDEENVHPQWVGYPKHFDHTDRVQLMDVDAPRVYPQTDEYRRTTAMVDAGGDSSYVVDFFRVAGGGNHHFSFHATTSSGVETAGLDLEAQAGGTYEGEEVPFGGGGHFSYLYDVERDDDPGAGFSVDWDVEDYWQVRDDGAEDVHLRLTMLNEVDDVALATGRPAEQDTENNPEELPFVLAHRGQEIEVPDPEVEYGDLVEFSEAERTGTRVSGYTGVKVQPSRDLDGFRVTLDPETANISHATIREPDGTVLAERDVSGVDPGESVDLPYDGIEAGAEYLVTFGNYGELYFRASSSTDYPVETDDYSVVGGVYTTSGSTTTSWRYSITEIEAITSFDQPEPPEPEPIETTFASVIEPYEGEPVVESSELVPVSSDDESADLDAIRAVKVELSDGRTDYVVSSTDAESDFVIDDVLVFKGAFGVYSFRDGEEEFVYGNDVKLFRTKGNGAPAIQHNQAAFEGTVDDFTKELSLENELEVTLANDPQGADLEDLVGQFVYVDPAPHDPVPDGVQEDDRYDNEARDKRNGVFRIEGVERTGDDRATIDIGEHTPIRRYYTNDPADGYSYSIEEGAAFVIPFGELVE